MGSSAWRRIAFAASILVAAFAATAGETVVELSVATHTSAGEAVEGKMPLTVYVPPGAGPFPAVVVSHGRPGTRAERDRMSRVRMASVAATLLGRNFVVLIPTRLGYAANSKHDPEFFVSCAAPRYPEAFAAGADQVAAAVRHAQSLPQVDPQRIFLIGHSVGGGVTASAASRGLPGVRAAAIVSAAHGGREGAPPCRDDLLKDTFRSFGAVAGGAPLLWMYVENDEWVPAASARAWFDAYTAAGGRGEFRLVGAQRNAHFWFLAEPGQWVQDVIEFFGRHGH